MKNRYIGGNVRIVIDLIEHLNKNNIPGLIMFADFEKTFNSLNHGFILHCFKSFNFCEKITTFLE